MARLKYKNEVPPGGFVFIQAESRLKIFGESFGDLVDRVISHRQHRGFGPTDRATVELEVERQMCSRLGKNFCRSEGKDDEWVPVTDTTDFLDWEKIKSFSVAAWNWVKNGGELCSPEESDRRAAICAACPCCEPWGGCRSCGLAKWATSAIPNDRRITEFADKGCLVCSCAISTLLVAPESVIVAADDARPLKYPRNCWKEPMLGR